MSAYLLKLVLNTFIWVETYFASKEIVKTRQCLGINITEGFNEVFCRYRDGRCWLEEKIPYRKFIACVQVFGAWGEPNLNNK